MAIDRLSSYNLHQSMLRNAGNAQLELSDLQRQVSSGLKSDTFAGLGSGIEKFADLETRISRSQTYLDTSTVVEGRLDVVDSALSSIIDTAGTIQNLIAQRRNGAVGNSMAYDTQIEGQWKLLVAQMNTSLEGRYVFSGTATNIPAVNDTDFPTLQVDGTADTGYYQGSAQDMTVRVDDNISITYNVRGDDPAFQKIFAGLAMAREYGTRAGDNTNMQAAYDFVQEGMEDLIAVRAEVNANKVTVIEGKNRLQAQQIYWRGLKEEISNTDLVAVSTQVAVNQGILQASFQVFAKISSLKLADFLR